VFLEPGRIERFEIDMTATGVRFLPCLVCVLIAEQGRLFKPQHAAE
jgi:hypothetical protein